MTKKKKSLIILIASLLVLLVAGIVIASLIVMDVFSEKIAKAENTYDPYYESFYNGENDPGITIDGKLDEDIWENKSWFQDTYLSKPNVKMPSWEITSHMTDMGLYIAAYIEDTNILNDGQHTMEGNTALEFYYFIASKGEEPSGKGIDRGYMVVDMRGDVHGTTGQFKRAVVVDGELNSGKTKSATMEMFFPWEFFGKVDISKGIPENIYLYPIYCAVFEGKETISTSISSMDSVVKAQLYLYKDYWRFGKDGYMTADREGAAVGDSVTGLAKTGNWDISKESEGIVRSANGTREHYMYFSDSYNSDFIAETTIVPVEQKAGDAKAGLYFLTGDGQYHLATLNTPNSLLVDSVNGTKNISKYILATYDSKAGIWEYHDECQGENPNATKKEGVTLTVVKNGGKFWYFVDGKFMTSQELDYMNTEVIPAFYAWAADAEFKGYSCEEVNEEQAKKYLNEHGVYSVDAKVKGSGGTVETSKIAVTKGQKYDITITCNSGYEVSSILVNGKECIADAKKNAVGGVYTITADASNQEIEVSFKKCDGHKLSGVIKGGDKAISGTLTITCDNNGILRYVVSAKEDKGYQVVMPAGKYTIVAEAEDYIMTTVKVTLNKDTTKDITLKPSMFASQVKVNGKTVSSNTKVWDRTQEAAGKIYGSYNNGTSLQPLYFAKTGNAAWFSSTIRYSTNFVEGGSYQSDLLGGLWVSDGSRTGWFGIRQHGIVYNGTWIEHVIGYDVLSTWNKQHQTADVDIILQNGEFHIYVDGIYATKLAVTKVLQGADKNAELAFGLVMHADKMADIEFSNISFSTDAKQIAKDFAAKQAAHTIPDGTLFAQEVKVNGKTVQSMPYRWDLTEIKKNTVTCNDGISTQPLWFAKTGKSALIQTTIRRVDNFKGTTGYETQPLAGIMVSDGTNQGFFGIRASAIVTNDNWDHIIGRDIMASWSNIMSAELEVALKDNEFHIYIDGIFVKAVKASDVIPGVKSGATLALGLVSEASGKTASVKFGDVKYTTDVAKVNQFLDSKDPSKAIPEGTIFAGVVNVNGKIVQSVVPIWDISDIANNVVIGNNGGTTHPLYFAKTGTTAVVETTVTRVDDKTATGRESQPMAGILITDGTNSGFLGVRAYSVVYGTTWLEKALGYDVFVTWSDAHQTADVDFVLKNNQIQIYVDGIFVKTVKVSDVAPGIKDGATVAIGLLMDASGKTASMKFADVKFTTEAAKVEEYLDEASGEGAIPSSSIFASKVTVNGKELQTILPIWDVTDIANNVVIGNNGGTTHPLYFKATGTAALVQMTATRLDDKTAENRESQPMAGIIVSDGTNSGFIGVRASAIVTNGNWDHIIGRDLFATWSTITTADIDFVIKDNEIHVYVDDVFMKKVKLSDVVPGIADGATVAIGLLMDASGKTAQMKFSDVRYTTDVEQVDDYLDKMNYDPSIADFIEYARALGQGYENGVGSNKIEVGANTTIFIGDSFFDRRWFWTDFYTDDYKDADAFCAGIGSTTTANWVHLIDEVFAVCGDTAPKNIVMHLGTNDLWSDTTTADDVVNGLKTVFDILHTKYPQTNIYYFGITHRGTNSAADRINAINSTISTWSESQDYLTYINTPARITADMLMTDNLHPKLETYAIFVKELAKSGCVILDKNGQPIPAPSETELSGLFANEVTVNGKIVTSAADKWDITQMLANSMRATSELGSTLQPIYFAQTGSTALLQTTVTVTGTTQGDPMAGIWLHDGTRRAYIGIRGNGLFYSPAAASWYAWWGDGGYWPTQELAPGWGGSTTADVDIVVADGTITIYVDKIYSKSVPLTDVMPDLAADAELAFGLAAYTDGTRIYDMTFSNIRFTTDAAKVTEFLRVRPLLAGTIFAEDVKVNGKTVTSATDKWDLSGAKNNTLKATSELGSTLQPMYFAETGKTMLMQTTVTVTSNTAGDPMAGIWLHDGTNRAFIGVRGSGLFYSPLGAGWNAWYGDGYWPTQELAPGWGGAATADIDIVLANETITIYVDDIYNKSVPLKDVMPNLAADADLAFGLVAYTDSTRVYDMTFSNIQFTTDADAVDEFLNPPTPEPPTPDEPDTPVAEDLFAESVTVNGVTVTSNTENWVYSNADKEATGTHGATNVFYMAPLYFKETGSSMLFKATITNTTETIKSEPMAGFYVTDGTNKGQFGLQGNGLVWGQWAHNWATEKLGYAVLSQWGNKSVGLEIVLKNGNFALYVDGLFFTNVTVSSVMHSGTYSGDLAFGITMKTASGEYPTTMKFSNITFTTDATEIDAFIASKATN